MEPDEMDEDSYAALNVQHWHHWFQQFKREITNNLDRDYSRCRRKLWEEAEEEELWGN